MPLNKLGYRMGRDRGNCSLLVWCVWSEPLSAEEANVVAQSADYFPDQIGNDMALSWPDY